MKIFLMLLAFFAPHARANEPLPENLSQECLNFINVVLPRMGWTGKFVTVPQDWNDPLNSPPIKVFYYYNASRNLETAKPILFLNGGPFSHYHGRAEALHRKNELYDPAGENVFVMLDQRGTGCSVPLAPQPNQTLAEIANYSTEGVVRDAEFIRRKVFPKRNWKIFAQSYGGFLTARYLELYPRSIDEIHLHGPSLNHFKIDFFLTRILLQNEILDRFLDHYKELDLGRAFAKFSEPGAESKYCLEPTAHAPKVCGRVLLDAILSGLGQGRGRDENTTEIWTEFATPSFI